MKKEKQFYLGMDVYKSWVDIAVLCVIMSLAAQRRIFLFYSKNEKDN